MPFSDFNKTGTIMIGDFIGDKYGIYMIWKPAKPMTGRIYSISGIA
jgi:hypothetical protein